MATVFKRNGQGNWIIQFFDSTGKRREQSSRTTDKRVAERIAAKLGADVALRRDGVIDHRMDRFAKENRRPLTEHTADYLTHCERVGQAAKNIVEKRRHLERFTEADGMSRLSDVTPERLVGSMAAMTVTVPTSEMNDEGSPKTKTVPASARSKNFRRQVWIAFMQWAVKVGRMERNPLSVVPKLDERTDRRRVRRPLSEGELSRLIAHARKQDATLNGQEGRTFESRRAPWYLAAVLAGLRKGDLVRLRWGDIDFDAGSITIVHGKARRTDVIPLHPDLAAELQPLRPTMGTPEMVAQARVFPTVVTDRTRQGDFRHAGIAPDADGRVGDLHALRTTLGTMLARAGVTPQVAQRVLRHADYKTTLAHYTVLGLSDTSEAIRALPGIQAVPDRLRATGTADETQRSPAVSPAVGAGKSGTGRSAADQAPPFAEDTECLEVLAFQGFGASDGSETAKRARRLERPTFSLEG